MSDDPYSGAFDMTAASGFDCESGAPPKMSTRTALVDGDMQLYAAAHHAQGKAFEDGVAHIRRRQAEVREMTGATYMKVFLTGGGNFRNDVAKTAIYKGNRADRELPDWFVDLKEWMIDEGGAILIDGMEADDALAQHQHRFNSLVPLAAIHDDPMSVDHTIICTGDKDLNVVAGWHYNIQTGRTFWADPYGALRLVEKKTSKKLEGEGIMFFLAQLLMGDATDNIPGAPAPTTELAAEFGFRNAKGIGPVAAYTILDGLPQTMDGLREGYRRVLKCYCGDLERLTEMGQLLWMRHLPLEMWEPATLGKVIKALDFDGYIYEEPKGE